MCCVEKIIIGAQFYYAFLLSLSSNTTFCLGKQFNLLWLLLKNKNVLLN